jgi:MFS family permease
VALGNRTFRSLAVPNYRRYFVGSAISVVGTWMQRVAQDWLVLQLTHSGVALGLASALQFLPVLVLGPWGGALVDRTDRRRLLIATQAASAVLAAVLGTVSATGVVTVSMVYALAFGLGVVTVFDSPARQTFVAEMVRPDLVVNAQSLYSTVHNGGRLVGPALAGVLIGTVGVAAAFWVNAVSFVAVLVMLWRIDVRQLRGTDLVARAPRQVRDGLAYVARDPLLRRSLLLVAVVGVFGQNFRVVLPLLASTTYHGGPQAYGWLTAALGLGAVAGALGAAATARPSLPALLVSCLAFGLVNLVASAAPSLAWALPAMVAIGVANIVFNTLARTILLLHSEPAMRGRVMAVHSMVFLGSSPFGGLLVGWGCEAFGARSGLLVAGVTAAVAAGLLWRPLPATSPGAGASSGSSATPSPR